MCFTNQLVIIIIIIILIFFIKYKKNIYENFKDTCPNNCIKESKNDNLINMCTESCIDIHNNCPKNCNIFCGHDATGICLPHCKNKCDTELSICMHKCDNMQPKFI